MRPWPQPRHARSRSGVNSHARAPRLARLTRRAQRCRRHRRAPRHMPLRSAHRLIDPRAVPALASLALVFHVEHACQAMVLRSGSPARRLLPRQRPTAAGSGDSIRWPPTRTKALSLASNRPPPIGRPRVIQPSPRRLRKSGPYASRSAFRPLELPPCSGRSPGLGGELEARSTWNTRASVPAAPAAHWRPQTGPPQTWPPRAPGDSRWTDGEQGIEGSGHELGRLTVDPAVKRYHPVRHGDATVGDSVAGGTSRPPAAISARSGAEWARRARRGSRGSA
jgi:hypothetical protein